MFFFLPYSLKDSQFTESFAAVSHIKIVLVHFRQKTKRPLDDLKMPFITYQLVNEAMTSCITISKKVYQTMETLFLKWRLNCAPELMKSYKHPCHYISQWGYSK